MKMLSQMQHSWVSSPIGIYTLLSLLKNYNVSKHKKLLQVEALLKNKKQYGNDIQVFCSNLKDVKNFLRHPQNVKTTEIKNFNEYIKKINNLESKESISTVFGKYLTDTKYILTNLSHYEDKWNKSGNSNGASMKIYNSFSYTEDIKYEARLLELPMQDKDFKFVIIVPNECDVLNTLVKKLYSEGLTAATASIQPLFTSVCSLNAPSINFNSLNVMEEIIDDSLTVGKAELGNVNINNVGVSIKILTFVFPTRIQTQVNNQYERSTNSFHFSILFKDISIFNGKYDIKNK